MPEPAKPPIKAWDELVGKPQNHVSKSHKIAPSRPDITTHKNAGSAALMSTIFEIVSATFGAKTNIATKLKNAAQRTANLGESTLVETIVAIELAES